MKQMKENVKKWKKLKLLCGICLLLTVLLAGCQKKMNFQDYLDLGEKYFTEANYEQAIVAFTKAIELEPKAMKAYEGLSNAYIKTENYDKAKEILEQGISVYEGLAAEEQTDEFKQIYEALLKLLEEVKGYLDTETSSEAGNENTVVDENETGDAEQERLIAEAKEKYGSILEQVIAEINSKEPTVTHYFTDDFQSFVKGLGKPLIWQLEDGRYLGLYRGTDGEIYVYLGEMDQGIRSGYGSWYGEYQWANEDGPEAGTSLFYGNWTDDYPNGAGTEIDTDNYGRVERQGNYLDGYENGTMNESWYWPDEGVNDSCTYNVTRGIPHVLYVDDEDGDNVVADSRKLKEPIDDGYQLVYEDGELWGIDGAMKE